MLWVLLYRPVEFWVAVITEAISAATVFMARDACEEASG